MNNLATIRPGFVRPAVAAKYVGVAPRTIRDWMQHRRLPFSRVSRKCVLIAVRDLDALVASTRVEAVAGECFAGTGRAV